MILLNGYCQRENPRKNLRTRLYAGCPRTQYKSNKTRAYFDESKNSGSAFYSTQDSVKIAEVVRVIVDLKNILGLGANEETAP